MAANLTAAGVDMSVLTPISSSVDIGQVLHLLQHTAAPAASWFKPLCVWSAAIWLGYRACQVLCTPTRELARLIGIDIPVAPVLDLAGLSADGAILRWSLPRGVKAKNKSRLEHQVLINGHVLETFVGSSDDAVTVSGLQPSTFYVARVCVSQENGPGCRSDAIRFRTKSASSKDFVGDAAVNGEMDGELNANGDRPLVPRAMKYRRLTNTAPPPTESALSRDAAVSVTGKKSITAASYVPEVPVDEGKLLEGVETVQMLTERLDALRHEADGAEKQAKAEEEEDQRLMEELTRERDDLKAAVAEREKASRNLKRELNLRERQNVAAQNERTKLERLMQQKIRERQKMRDDADRCEVETAEMRDETVRIREAMEATTVQIQTETAELRARVDEEVAKTRKLDEEIKAKNAEIKQYERLMKPLTFSDGETTELSLVQLVQQDAEEERQWQIRKAILQQQLIGALHDLDSAKRVHGDQMRYYKSMRSHRLRDEQKAFALDPSLPTRRQSSWNGTGESSLVPAPSLKVPRFFNYSNGAAIPSGTLGLRMTDEERETLTGGAAMSPNAGAGLIPTDLFNNEVEPQRSSGKKPLVLPGLGALPGLPGLPDKNHAADAERSQSLSYPVSPGSIGSAEMSMFNSPRASQVNLAEPLMFNSDRRSIRSNHSASTGQTRSSRFSSMFGLKSRTKNLPLDETGN
ncbi:hypothetical protein K470DRAFT_101129 [Piedraia hortae CBS 480.64]|uniref:Fibronectin type-III domain-containing protein n=1 Tax=Piedraia hortae CBS 480.64 TaxID=1314780 RepID=A0A6A7BXC0_9PEZI|nr:hypothetical protein K470DRAFT_101129 [Piedraia hortae CBS 480.64]